MVYFAMVINAQLGKFQFHHFFLGDQKDENAVLEWLLDADNRELDDAIEMVNEKMLVKLLEKTQFMAVFFCKYSDLITNKD